MLAKQKVRHASRRGLLSIELLFVFPILLAILFATVEFSLWLAIQQQVALASREGARVAATGGTEEDINTIVRLVLGDARYQIATVQVAIVDENDFPLASGEPVAVLVQLPAGAVIPDLLGFVGLSIRGETLISQTTMRKE